MTERPQRIQLQRTRGWRKPPGAVVVARPTTWGNPFRLGGWFVRSPQHRNTPYPGQVIRSAEPVRDRAHAVELFCEHIAYEDVAWDPAEIRRVLGGRDLACWCPLTDADGNRVPCHADVLLQIANAEVTA